MSRIPDFILDMFFVERGYEARMYVDGIGVEVQSRDFVGSYPVGLTINNICNLISLLLPDTAELRYTVPK